VYAVAAALFAKTSEIAKVFPDLRRGDLEFLTQLLGTNYLDAVIQQAVQYPHVLWKPTDDNLGHFRTCQARFRVGGHGVSVPSPTAFCWRNNQIRLPEGELRLLFGRPTATFRTTVAYNL